MHVQVFSGFETFLTLRDGWRRLHDLDAQGHVFLSFEWLAAALETLGGRHAIVVAKPSAESGELLAAMALRAGVDPEAEVGRRLRLRPAGDQAADFGGFLCRPGEEARAAAALAEALRRLGVAQLDTGPCVQSDARLVPFLRQFLRHDHAVRQRVAQPNPDGIDNGVAPFLRLPASWEDYLSQWPRRNARQKMRRFLRKLDAGEGLSVTRATAATLERDLEAVDALWTENWGARKGERLPRLRRFIREGGAAFYRFGAGDVRVLWQGERPTAANLYYVDRAKGALHFAFGGRDRSVTTPPPGFLLHCATIRAAIAEGYRIYDFLKGNEAYKYDFGAVDRPMRRYIVEPSENDCAGERVHTVAGA